MNALRGAEKNQFAVKYRKDEGQSEFVATFFHFIHTSVCSSPAEEINVSGTITIIFKSCPCPNTAHGLTDRMLVALVSLALYHNDFRKTDECRFSRCFPRQD